MATLGRGGQGVVFRAYDPELKRDVALKLLPSNTLHESQVVREAQALAKLSHDNVVQIYETGHDDEGRAFIVMELVEGMDLGTWLEETPRRWSEIIETFVSAGRGLVAVHSQDIIHRDFKPRNVLVADDGRVKVVDFGIAASPAKVPTQDGPSPNAVIGTPPYMAPEQLKGQAPDALGDQYSFCVSLFEVLYGPVPRGPRSALPSARAKTSPYGNRDSATRILGRVPSYYRAILKRGLSHEPTDRYPDMGALLAALSRGPWWHRTANRAGLLVVGGALVGAIIIGTIPDAPPDPPIPCQDRVSAVAEWDEHHERIAATVDARDQSVVVALDTVNTILNRQAERIDGAFDDVCASPVEPSTEAATFRRLQCLQYAREELSGTIETLSTAQAEQLPSFPDRLLALPSIDACERPREVFESCEPWVVPAGLEKEAAQVDETLAKARSAWLGGNYGRASTLARDAIELASAPKLLPRRARALLEHGRMAFEAEHLDDALEASTEAIGLAEREGCDRLAAEALVVTSKALVLQRSIEHVAANNWSQLALDKLERIGTAGRALASGLSARGLVVNMTDGSIEEADGHLASSIELLEVLPEAPEVDLELSHVLLNRGSTLKRLGRLNEAIAALQRGIVLRTKHLGPDHPSLQKLYYQLGLRRMDAGELDEAEAMLTRSLRVLEEGLPTTHVRRGEIHLALTQLNAMRHDMDEALKHAQEARAAYEGLPPDHLQRSDALQAIGQVLLMKEQPEEGLAHLREALRIVQGAPQATQRDRGIATYTLGEAYGRLDNWETALQLFEEGADLLRHTRNRPGDDVFAIVSFDVAEAHLELGSFNEAVEPLESAIAIWSEFDNEGEMLALSSWLLGKARCLQGQPTQGQMLVQDALDYLKRSPEDPISSELISEINTWMPSHCIEEGPSPRESSPQHTETEEGGQD